MIPLACWRCEKPGHTADDCDRPPAATRQELNARIARLVQRWDAGYGVISAAQKTAFIAAEVRQFEGKVKAK